MNVKEVLKSKAAVAVAVGLAVVAMVMYRKFWTKKQVEEAQEEHV